MVVKIRRNDVVIRMTTVYGSPYEDGKREFLSELHELFVNWDGPAIIGGDFNLVRSKANKSNGVVDFKWVNKFNAWVEIWALMEINLTGITFTWSNNQDNLVMSIIDRIFYTTSFDSLFSFSSCKGPSQARE